MNQTAFYNLSYGVYACTSWKDGKPVGCIANSAMQITSSPATIAVSINHNNFTHDCIKETGYFAITVLGEHIEPTIIGTLGFRSGRDFDKFANVAYDVRGKMPVVKEGVAYFCCKVVNVMETSTHTVFLGEVEDADLLTPDTPMTYSYYHKVLKGKTAKNAPTFIEEKPKQEEKKAQYVCTVCGYVYDGEIPFEELPDDWKCPLCKAGKDKFEKR